MRAYVPEYDLAAPSSLNEALMLVAEGARPLAGGTDLMVLFEAGKLPYRKFVSLWKLDDLRGIAVSDTHLTLGALTTYTEIQRDRNDAARVSAAGPRGELDRSGGHAESRNAGRQHRERFACR